MSYESDLQRVIKNAQMQGFRVCETKRGHWQFYSPNKKDIVVASGTSCNHEGFQKFMAEMRRAGYADATTSMGDALKDAMLQVSTPVPVEEPKKTIRQMILELLERHPSGMSSQDILACVRSSRPEVSADTVSQTTLQMVGRGIERRGRGWYRLSKTRTEIQVDNFFNEHPTSGVSPTETGRLNGNSKHESNQPKEVSNLDNDIREIDEALAALARIEGVVRRTRERLAKLKEVRDIL